MRTSIVPSEVVPLSKRPAANQTAGGIFGILPLPDYRSMPSRFSFEPVLVILNWSRGSRYGGMFGSNRFPKSR